MRKIQSITTALALLFVLGTTAFSSQAQTDTLRLRLPQAEKLFLDSNLLLLAQHYNVSSQQALIQQARLWPNPNLALAFGPLFHVHNPEASFFNNASFSGSLSQLILLAGKRNKQVKLAEANAQLALQQFFDLLRTLKYTLRTDFFSIYFTLQSARVYDQEIASLQQITRAFEEQAGKGYIAEKEVLRIKAQLYSLQSEYNDLINSLQDAESELRLVLQTKANVFILPELDPDQVVQLDPYRYPLTTLLDSAYHNRTDLQIARTNSELGRLNLNYQKAMAVPDLTLSFNYDQQGSYVNNFQALGAAMDLPVLNRNQGNIRSAQWGLESARASQRSIQATVEENVSRSLQKALAEDKLTKGMDPKFEGDFSRMLQEVFYNYQKRNISILDFLDFYDSYKQNWLQINAVKAGKATAFEAINYYTGTNFFN